MRLRILRTFVTVMTWLSSAVHSGECIFLLICVRWWSAFVAHPGPVLILTLIGIASILLLSGIFLRVVFPRATLLISDFEMPKDGVPGLHVTGRTIGSLLADEMLAIVKTGMSAQWNWSSPLVPIQELKSSPLTFTTANTSPGFEIEVKGVSWGRVTAAWRLVRQRQQILSGDMVADSDHVVLAARVTGLCSWRTLPFRPDEAGLREGVRLLADAALRDIHPFISGVCELALGHEDAGIALLRNCVLRWPSFVRAAEQLVSPLCRQGRFSEAKAIIEGVRIPWYRRRDRGYLQKCLMALYAKERPVDWNLVIRHARLATRLAPRVPLFQRNLALVASEIGCEKEARRACLRAKRLAPGHPFLTDLETMVDKILTRVRATTRDVRP